MPSTTQTKYLEKTARAFERQGLSRSTRSNYSLYIRKFLSENGGRSPRNLGRPEAQAFISGEKGRPLSRATQYMRMMALRFLYREVLQSEPAWLSKLSVSGQARRASSGAAKKLNLEKIAHAVALLPNTEAGFVARLIDATGLRLNEALSLRLGDIDLEAQRVLVQDDSGAVHHATPIPQAFIDHEVDPIGWTVHSDL